MNCSLLLRNLHYANHIKTFLLEYDVSANIVQLDDIKNDTDGFIIIDAHYECKMSDCAGNKFVDVIRLEHGAFQPILLMSWFSKYQIAAHKAINEEGFESLHNCRCDQFPITRKIIKFFINKFINGLPKY